jgi:hypothetical protein
MKILFIESREIINLFRLVGDKLKEEGYSSNYLILNKFYSKKRDDEILIPATRKKYKVLKENIKLFDKIKTSDRQFNDFGAKDYSHYQYYHDKITEIISKLNPDIIIGEAASFQDLLTIEVAKKNNILYLNPMSCRYPKSRFSFYQYDSCNPYLGSGEIKSEEKTILEIDEIINRKILPDYMKKKEKTKKKTFLKDRFNKFLFSAMNDKNTPNSLKYISKNRENKRIRKKWEAVSKVQLIAKKFGLLFPLQMQPEGNIDVFGVKYRNQTKVISKLISVIPKDIILYVKPNPKSRYEITDDIIKLAKENSNLILLPHSLEMSDIIKNIDLVITNTGTIAIECILNNTPISILSKYFFNTASNCIYINDINDINDIINLVKINEFPTLTKKEILNYFNSLRRTSYEGIMSSDSTDNTNINLLTNSFLSMLLKHERILLENIEKKSNFVT